MLVSCQPCCRVSGESPTHADSYDIDMEVPAPITDQATAGLLQNLNSNREVEQVPFEPSIKSSIIRFYTHVHPTSLTAFTR